MAEHDIPYEVPELHYVMVDPSRMARMGPNLGNWWGDQTAIVTCVRCGRYTDGPNRRLLPSPYPAQLMSSLLRA